MVTRRNLFQAEGMVGAKALRQDNLVSAKNSQESSMATVNG